MNFTAIFCCYVLLPYLASLVSPPNEAITCNAGFLWDILEGIGLQTGIIYYEQPKRTPTRAPSCPCGSCKQSVDESGTVWRDIPVNDWSNEKEDQMSDDDSYEERRPVRGNSSLRQNSMNDYYEERRPMKGNSSLRQKSMNDYYEERRPMKGNSSLKQNSMNDYYEEQRPVNRNTSLRSNSMNYRHEEESEGDDSMVSKYTGIQSVGSMQKKSSFGKMDDKPFSKTSPANENVENEGLKKKSSKVWSFNNSGTKSKKGST